MNIDILITELIELDPSFQEHKDHLRKIIQKFIELKPNIQVDENFRKELKNLLLSEVQDLKMKKKIQSPKHNIVSYIFTFFGGALIASFVIVPSMYYSFSPEKIISPLVEKVAKPSFNLEQKEVIPEESKSFRGKTVTQEKVQHKNVSTGEVPAQAPVAPQISSKKVVGGSMATDMSFAPSMSGVKYVYSGEKFVIHTKTLEGFQYKDLSLQGADEMIKKLNIQNIELGKFKNIGIQNISFLEKKDDGYMVNLDGEGNISINQNYNTWKDPYLECNGNEVCLQKLQLKKEDLPSDQELVAISKDFLDTYKLQMADYGDPIIQKNWEGTPDDFISDQLTIMYPQKIQGKNVYDEQGNLIGIQLSLNIRQKKIIGLWGLNIREMKGISFESETDTTKILAIAEKGGGNNYELISQDVKSLNLGNPEEIYVKIYEYSNGKNIEYIVPGFLFPINNNKKGDTFSKKNVIVPLVKQFFEKSSDIQASPMGIPRRM